MDYPCASEQFLPEQLMLFYRENPEPEKLPVQRSRMALKDYKAEAFSVSYIWMRRGISFQKVNRYKNSVENYIRSSHVTLPALAQLLRDVAGNGYSVERKLLAERMKVIIAAVEASISECRKISEQTGGYISFLYSESLMKHQFWINGAGQVYEDPF